MVVVLPIPTGPAICPSSSRLALSASGSDIGEHQIYTQVEDTLTPSWLQFQSLKDSLRFEIEENLKSGDPS